MNQMQEVGVWSLTSFVSHTSAPSVYMTSSFWLPFPGAKRIFFTQPRCVGIPLKTATGLVILGGLKKKLKQYMKTQQSTNKYFGEL